MALIQQFKANMAGGGARSNQFKCILTFPDFVKNMSVANGKITFMAKAAQLPSSDIADIEISYRGRPVHFAGERTFQPWTITVYNDNDFIVRDAFEDWVNKIGNSDSTNGIMAPTIYQRPMEVHQLNRLDESVKIYSFYDAYPVSVAGVQLDWDNNAQIQTYDVTFQYNYWKPGAVK
jgi:hypothetical protein